MLVLHHTCEYYMFVLHVSISCQYYILLELHVGITCQYSILLVLHVGISCQYYMSVSPNYNDV